MDLFLFYLSFKCGALVWSAFGAIWEDPEGGFYQIRGKKSFKTRPNTPYGEETSRYSPLQGGVTYILIARYHFFKKILSKI